MEAGVPSCTLHEVQSDWYECSISGLLSIWYRCLCAKDLLSVFPSHTEELVFNNAHDEVEPTPETVSHSVSWSLRTLNIVYAQLLQYMSLNCNRSRCHGNGPLNDGSKSLRSILTASRVILNPIIVRCVQSAGCYKSLITICGNSTEAVIIEI